MAARSGARFATATRACASRCHEPMSGGVRSSLSRRVVSVSASSPVTQRSASASIAASTRCRLSSLSASAIGPQPLASVSRRIQRSQRVVAHRPVAIVERLANQRRALRAGHRRPGAEEGERAETAVERRVLAERVGEPFAIDDAGSHQRRERLARERLVGRLVHGRQLPGRALPQQRQRVVRERPSLRFRRASASSARAAVARGPCGRSRSPASRACAASNCSGVLYGSWPRIAGGAVGIRLADGLRDLCVGLIRPRVRAKRQRQRQVRGLAGRGIRDEPHQRSDQIAPLEPAEARAGAPGGAGRLAPSRRRRRTWPARTC